MKVFAMFGLALLLVSPAFAAQQGDSCDTTGEVAELNGEDASLTLKTTDGDKRFKVDVERVRSWQDLEEGERVSVRCFKDPQNGPTITAISRVG